LYIYNGGPGVATIESIEYGLRFSQPDNPGVSLPVGRDGQAARDGVVESLRGAGLVEEKDFFIMGIGFVPLHPVADPFTKP
jgi:hypothetical protein